MWSRSIGFELTGDSDENSSRKSAGFPVYQRFYGRGDSGGNIVPVIARQVLTPIDRRSIDLQIFGVRS